MLTASFEAQDGQGRPHTIVEITEYDDVSPLIEGAPISGVERLQPATGEGGSRRAEGCVSVVNTGALLKSSAPSAL